MTYLLLASALATTNIFYSDIRGNGIYEVIMSHSIDHNMYGLDPKKEQKTQIWFDGYHQRPHDHATYKETTGWTNLTIQTKLKPTITESNGFYWIKLEEKK